MLDAAPGQFRLSDDGFVLFQPHPTNPLPGDPVARLRRGAAALSPNFELIADAAALNGVDAEAAREKIAAWLTGHIEKILEPLAALAKTEDLAQPVADICRDLHDSMGVTPRENLSAAIALLDSDMRQAVRARGIKLGPVLVFLPALGKPAAVRLKAVLWWLWQDKNLPAPTPKDGVVSYKIDTASVDENFQRAVGYPVYGPRAIRIDMLDRVISAVYDGAQNGKFRAEHKMAEWLGCTNPELYEILEAMGHVKIEDAPLPAPKAEADTAAVAASSMEARVDEKPAENMAQAPRPLLALFRLKRHAPPAAAAPRNTDAAPGEIEKRPHKKYEAPAASFKKKKPKADKFKKFEKNSEREARIISSKAPPQTLADSPFAILQQLKVKGDAA